MKALNTERLSMLARTGSIHRVAITPYLEADGGGWWVQVWHDDRETSRDLRTSRGTSRVFRTVDAALAAVRACQFKEEISVLPWHKARAPNAKAELNTTGDNVFHAFQERLAEKNGLDWPYSGRMYAKEWKNTTDDDPPF